MLRRSLPRSECRGVDRSLAHTVPVARSHRAEPVYEFTQSMQRRADGTWTPTMPCMELQGKNVVVTGAGRGIGEALARAFHAEGARLVLADVNGAADVAASLDQTAATAVGLTADVGTEDGNRVLVAEATDAIGPIDLFFANAGVGTGHELADTDEHAWDLAFA